VSGRVVIIGGGISGVSAAYYLARAGVPSTLVERQSRLGGVIQTELVDGCLIEAGPDSFLAAKPWALDLIRELGLEGDVIGSNDHLRVTYVVKRGRLVPLPDGLMMMVPTRVLPVLLSPLVSWKTKVRMGLEWFRKPAVRPAGDRSVAEFITSHYGQEAVDYLAEPLLAGVYGGDPERLSVSSVLARFLELEARYGSLTRGVLAGRGRAQKSSTEPVQLFQTLKGGLSQLVRAAVAAAATRLQIIQGNAEALEPSWRVRVNGCWIEATNVILAVPAYEAGALVSSFAPELGSVLSQVEYSSSLTIALGYERRALDHPLSGFGFLVPKKERRKLVACTWVGTKFSHRVPENRAVLRCFVGGPGDAAVVETDSELVAAAQAELRDLMGIEAKPLFARVSRWPRSMAQYTVGHQARMERVHALAAHWPGLFLVGNAYTGIGIPDCIRMGKAAAEAIARR